VRTRDDHSLALLLPLLLALQLPPSPLATAECSNLDAARIERLEAWLAAVDQHQPGQDDPAARRIAAWPRVALEQVRLDVRPVLILMRDPEASGFQTESASGIPAMIVYGRRELEALGAMAAARGTDVNRVLKRGAMLHTDIAMFVPPADREVPSVTRARSRTGDPLLQYYAELFLGREADAAGRRDEAIAAYERALVRYPRAQSPRLALSELATRRGDRSAAAATARMVMESPPDQWADPWWSYNASAGRSAAQRLRELLSLFATAPRPGTEIP
jgi:hypothetical protein